MRWSADLDMKRDSQTRLAATSLFRAAFRNWVLWLPLLLLLPGLAAFPYPSASSQYSDLVISHYPNLVFLRDTLVFGHTLPLWSPAILSGAPFFADPLNGLWYPPGWLALLLPLPLGFNLLVAAHLIFGGAGMLRLLRREGLVQEAALFGALAFEALPKLFAHYGAGHLTLLYAVPWTPWLLLAQWRSAAAGVPTSGLKRLLDRLNQPGVILGLIFLADPRWAAYAGVLWLGYAIFKRCRALVLLSQSALAALISAPLALPLMEYTRLTTRASLSAEEVFRFSLPPERLLGLVYPDLGGFHEWMLYPGAAVLCLGLLALIWRRSRGRAVFWLVVAGVSLVISLGDLVPGVEALAHLPGVSLLRVPSRALFLSGLALAAVAAFGLDNLLNHPTEKERRQAGLALTAVAIFSLALAGLIWGITQALPLNFSWGAAFILATAVWIGIFFARRLPLSWWIGGLLGICLLDLGFVDHSLFYPKPAGQVLSENQAVANYLSVQPGLFRVYSPSYSLPQQTAAREGLQLADGINPLQLAAYVNFMSSASGVPAADYSVTLPPFANGEPGKDNSGEEPNPRLLGLLNVRYIVAAFDLPVQGLALVARLGETRIYENLQALPRAWLQPADSEPGQEASGVALTAWTPNRIVVDVEVPANGTNVGQLLVLSELDYPGWQARIDGQPATIRPVAGILRGVMVEPGAHQVVFEFKPVSFYLGLVLGALGLAFAALFKGRDERQTI
jgi:hypothetical protein